MPARKPERTTPEAASAAVAAPLLVERVPVFSRARVQDEVVLLWADSPGCTLELAGRSHALEPARFVLFWAGFSHRLQWAKASPPPVWIRLPFGWFAGLPLSSALVDALLGGRVVCDWTPDPGDARLVARWSELGPRADTRLIAAARFELTARLIRLEHTLPVAFLAPTPRLRGEIAQLAGEPPQLSAGTDKATGLLQYLQANFSRPIDVADCARNAGLSPGHASALFKRTFGGALKAHLSGLRLKHAQRLLATTHEKVQTIANACGFASASRFYDAFVREVGCTPQVFRERSPRPAPPERHDALPPGLPPVIAWVDETPANNYEERRFLHGLGLLCDSYTNNADVLAAVSGGRYALVISDLARGPGAADGWDLLREIRAREWSLPVLFYTGAATEERRARASKLGGQGVFDRSRPLVDRVLELLGR